MGKSSILRRFNESSFKEGIPPTTSAEFVAQTVQIDDIPIKLMVWDTSGTEEWLSVTRNYFKGTAGVILVYDITSRKSFVDIQMWYKEVLANSNHDQMTFLLVGNKSDLQSK